MDPASHYFAREAGGREEHTTIDVPAGDGRTLQLLGVSGVFSSRGLDPGTKTLLRTIPEPPQAGALLDLGCGWGPIACSLAARAPATEVWALDVNDRARQYTARNARRLKLTNVTVTDELPPELRFTGIFSNPPIRIGKPALHALLDETLVLLRPDAFAYLVVRKALGSDSLVAWLEQKGHRCERLRSSSGYRVLQVAARPEA